PRKSPFISNLGHVKIRLPCPFAESPTASKTTDSARCFITLLVSGSEMPVLFFQVDNLDNGSAECFSRLRREPFQKFSALHFTHLCYVATLSQEVLKRICQQFISSGKRPSATKARHELKFWPGCKPNPLAKIAAPTYQPQHKKPPLSLFPHDFTPTVE